MLNHINILNRQSDKLYTILGQLKYEYIYDSSLFTLTRKRLDLTQV